MFSQSFEQLRNELYLQYTDVAFDRNYGTTPEQLRRYVKQFLIENKDMPRILLKAHLLSYLLKNAQISVDENDFYADKLNHGDILIEVRNIWQQDIMSHLQQKDVSVRQNAALTGCFEVELDFGHTSPDWDSILRLGICGLKERAKKNLNKSPTAFNRAVIIAYDAIAHFIKRLADKAAEYGTAKMDYVASDLYYLAENPPKTFHQALQLAYLYHEIQEIEGENVRSMGGFDRLYYSFYKSDLQNGIITPTQAKELMKFFFFKFMAKTQGKAFGKNFYFAGGDGQGNDCVNELSYLALEAYYEMDVVDPKFSVRINKKTPPEFIKRAAECIRAGRNSIVFINDTTVIKAMLRQGKTLEDAQNYTVIGCYEPAVMGKEISCSMAIRMNLAKCVELVLFNGIDPNAHVQTGLENAEKFLTFDDFFKAYLKQLEYQITLSTDMVKSFEEYWNLINPSPVLSGTFESCILNGRDISEKGAVYNTTGVMCGCFASAVDSLTAVKSLVFDKKLCSLEQLKEALQKNWDGYTHLHSQSVLCNKWGNNQSEPDNIGILITQNLSQQISSMRNSRNGYFQMALFSIDYCHIFGRNTGALPDGHKKGMPLSKNLSSVTAMDKNGVTALINSVTKLDFAQCCNGAVLDIMLHPSAVQGDDGLNAFLTLLNTYFQLGGLAVHFNIFNVENLIEAQKEPEKYATLQVRVCGWNSYFVNLSKAEQDEFIKQANNISL